MDLDVKCLAPVTSPSAPSAKDVDSVSLGPLLTTFAATDGVLPVLIMTARCWLVRHTTERRISVAIDGDTIVLGKGSAQKWRILIEAYLRRREVG